MQEQYYRNYSRLHSVVKLSPLFDDWSDQISIEIINLQPRQFLVDKLQFSCRNQLLNKKHFESENDLINSNRDLNPKKIKFKILKLWQNLRNIPKFQNNSQMIESIIKLNIKNHYKQKNIVRWSTKDIRSTKK